ncbi:MAG: hypothetical protein KDC14_07000 [Planctomycetes bacterium]|nr:hypothetical protein [Planctomycetota bacterium]
MPVALAFTLSTLAGCATQVVDLRAEDTSTLSTDARVSWALQGKRTEEAQAAAELVPRTETAFFVDLDIAHTQGGEDEFALPPGQGILLGKTLFTGSDLNVSFDATRILLDARISSPPRNGFVIEGFFGLEFTKLNLTLRQASGVTEESASGDVSSVGPAVGLAVAWQPIDWLRCSTEGRVSYGISSDVVEVAQSSLDIGVGIHPWKHVGAYLGWRTLNYGADDSALFSSDIHLKLAGPVLGLRFGF